MKNYLMEVETIEGEIKVAVIGGGHIVKKLSSVLYNRKMACSVIPRARDLDLSSTLEFIFLFNNNNESIPEAVLNFVESIKSKLIIVSLDMICGDNLVKQCLEKDIDYCCASIYDLFDGSGSGSALENIFLGVRKKKLISFKNDQIIITPIFVDDAVEALCRVAFATQTYKKNFALTGKDEIPLVGFVQKVGVEAASSSGVLLKSEEHGEEYPESMARHEKIIKRDESFSLLSWKPEIDLVQGIKLALGSQLIEKEDPLPEVKKKMTLNP